MFRRLSLAVALLLLASVAALAKTTPHHRHHHAALHTAAAKAAGYRATRPARARLASAGHPSDTPRPKAGRARSKRARIERTLDIIDTPDFLLGPVAIASGHNTVKDGFLATSEVQALSAAPTEAVPAMLARLGRPHGLRNPSARIVYFLAFEQIKDRRTLPALARYLDSLPESEGAVVGLPSHPFQYALDALRAQVPLGPPPGADTGVLFRARHALAAQVRALLARRAGHTAQRNPSQSRT